MIARRTAATTPAPGPVRGSAHTPRWVWRVWFGHCVAVCGTLLLAASVAVALYVATGGTHVPRDLPYRWTGAGPVHVTARGGQVSCAYSAEGAPGRARIGGYDLVLASVLGGRTIRGRSAPGGPAAQSPNILICDGPVTVTGGWVVRLYPLAGSWARFITYLLAMLLGALAGRRPVPTGPISGRRPGPTGSVSGQHPGSPASRPREPAIGSHRNPAEPLAEQARRHRAADIAWTPTARASGTIGNDGRGRPMLSAPAALRRPALNAPLNQPRPVAESRGFRPAWAATNVKADRIRAEALARPMRFERTNTWGHAAMWETAGIMSFVAALGVLPLLLAMTGSAPPWYVTYPAIVAVLLGIHVALLRRLYYYRLGRPWQPKPRSELPPPPPPAATPAREDVAPPEQRDP
ncbi:hypothetical protein [Rhizomonospora bruguierae]|uniref:hypothetical protein n=1 Tax=Rhizomonospora bruguierae TaxID=1581705 RepID=UPI001BCF5EA3|nr:hypothetical protein [Micromonospora sp. NBRC 107566]